MIKLETYYDIGCDKCARHRSTDYGFGLETNRKILRRFAKSEGWSYHKETNETLCPECNRRSKNFK